MFILVMVRVWAKMRNYTRELISTWTPDIRRQDRRDKVVDGKVFMERAEKLINLNVVKNGKISTMSMDKLISNKVIKYRGL